MFILLSSLAVCLVSSLVQQLLKLGGVRKLDLAEPAFKVSGIVQLRLTVRLGLLVEK